MAEPVDFEVMTMSGPRRMSFEVKRIWNGGWAGRDRNALDTHIEEMRRLGVAAPTTTPIYFPLGRNLLSTESEVQVLGNESSGEVEYALLCAAGTIYVTVASDHTDRALERYSIQASKQLYPDVLGREVWPYEECRRHWDELVLRCWGHRGHDRSLYQEARLVELISADEWIDILTRAQLLKDGLVFLSGTPPTLGGVVAFDAYDLELEDPVLKRSIRHSYTVEVLGSGRQ